MSLKAFPVVDWGFFRFHGPDVTDFLQGLVTADLKKLASQACLPACVLTPKGLLVADCELYMEGPGIILAVTRPAAAEGFQKAFEKKIMLSNSKFERLSPRAWLFIGAGYDRGLPWSRVSEPARLVLGVDPPSDAEILSEEAFHALRINAGMPWFGADLDAQTLPLEGRLEAAISVDKGCYMGQETVSRLIYRGHVNRCLMGIRFSGAVPAPNSVLLHDGREIGRLTSVSGSVGVGMVRYDDARAGLKITADGREGELFIFASWPKTLSKA
jgi:folate-binding protein YgfZ